MSNIQKRLILLPQELNNKLEGRLQQLVNLNEESNGIFLYKPIPKSSYMECKVDKLYMTGVGTSGHVRADQTRMDIINEFFQRHPEYRFIKWHVHSEGTEKYWHDKLSDGDIGSYQEQLRMDPEFIGMMISPSKRIIVAQGTGKGITKSKVVPTWPDFYKREKYLGNEIDLAAKKLGYTQIPRLEATRKKRR